MSTNRFNSVLRAALAAATLLAAGIAGAATTITLTAQRATAYLPDGAAVPMWQFCGITAANADLTARSTAKARG